VAIIDEEVKTSASTQVLPYKLQMPVPPQRHNVKNSRLMQRRLALGSVHTRHVFKTTQLQAAQQLENCFASPSASSPTTVLGAAPVRVRRRYFGVTSSGFAVLALLKSNKSDLFKRTMEALRKANCSVLKPVAD